MAFDYKRELELIVKNVITIPNTGLLVRMVLRMLRQKLKIRHVGILLYNKEKNNFVLTSSGDPLKTKIPVSLACLDRDNPLVRFFREHRERAMLKHPALLFSEAKSLLRRPDLAQQAKQLLKAVLYQMEILEIKACAPCYFRGHLLGILLLGEKNNGVKFQKDELDFLVAVASSLAMAIENSRLYKELHLELDKKQQLFIRIINALAASIEAKDYYTHGHTARVTNLSLEIARAIGQQDKKVLDEKFMENLYIAALLHDIGKIGVAESILNKKGPLSEEERRKVREHPQIGVAILRSIKELQDAILGVKYHHERYDGLGYPEGLKGNQIPLIAAIISVADSFDAMTTDRPHRKALRKNDVVKEIRSLSAKQFNPQVVSAFIQLYEKNKI
ncbi:MAG: HD-GYP domain-containing protein [Candidatus Omnitrophica bacterium]|nr:HD-GYP domain-containing protein [Candidatus Omnitrophota bacterium]